MDANKQLKTLLMRSARSAKASWTPYCLAALDDLAEELKPTQPVPLKEVQDIYRARARRNQRNGSPIAGFDELLEQLEIMEDEPIRICSFTAASGIYIVFANASLEKLIGVLFKATDTPPQTQITLAALAAK